MVGIEVMHIAYDKNYKINDALESNNYIKLNKLPEWEKRSILESKAMNEGIILTLDEMDWRNVSFVLSQIGYKLTREFNKIIVYEKVFDSKNEDKPLIKIKSDKFGNEYVMNLSDNPTIMLSLFCDELIANNIYVKNVN